MVQPDGTFRFIDNDHELNNRQAVGTAMMAAKDGTCMPSSIFLPQNLESWRVNVQPEIALMLYVRADWACICQCAAQGMWHHHRKAPVDCWLRSYPVNQHAANPMVDQAWQAAAKFEDDILNHVPQWLHASLVMHACMHACRYGSCSCLWHDWTFAAGLAQPWTFPCPAGCRAVCSTLQTALGLSCRLSLACPAWTTPSLCICAPRCGLLAVAHPVLSDRMYCKVLLALESL